MNTVTEYDTRAEAERAIERAIEAGRATHGYAASATGCGGRIIWRAHVSHALRSLSFCL